MKYKITFAKLGYLKFISHLDLIRLFKRAFKRGNISLEFSQGFNPHPKMSFAQPLPLGYESVGEILDIETKVDYDVMEIVSALKDNLPKEIRVTRCKKEADSYKGSASLITEAGYIIQVDKKYNLTKALIDNFVNQNEILVQKKQKKKKELKTIDIKGKIRSVDFDDANKEFQIILSLDCGSISNLSPDLFMQGLNNFLIFEGYKEILLEDTQIYRTYLK